MVGIAFVLSTPDMMSNMFRLLFINRGYVEELRFAYVISFLGNIQWTLYLLIIAIYIYEARRLEKGTSITESLNPIKSNQLYALQKRYKDGKITYYEYQEAKSNLLASEDDLS
jgi:uncharacterized membrane protein